MKRTRLRRRAFFGSLGVIWALGAAVTAAWFWLSSSAERPDGPVFVAGMGDTVFVSLDSLGIPTIRAYDELDAWRALGYMHAEDRLWQLAFFRRIAAGRLSELFGERAYETDRFVRTLGLPRIARSAIERLSPEERAVLEAYAEGVNAGISDGGPLPPEFHILRFEPEPWTPEASLSIGLLMNLDLSHWQRDLSRHWARAHLTLEKAAYLRPAYPEWGPVTLDGVMEPPPETVADLGSGRASWQPAGFATYPGPAPPTAGSRRGPAESAGWNPLAVLAAASIRVASNAWVVGPSRTTAGLPILANDMHLALRAPSIWYVAAVHGARSGLHVAGFTLPGLPGIVVGFNRDVAWGATNGMVDDMDFVIETVDADGRRYRNGDVWLEFQVRPETIQVRGEAARIDTVRATIRGSVISDALPGLEETLSAMFLPAHVPVGLDGLLAMNRAGSLEEFHAAAAAFTQPHLNLVVAGADGRIGFHLAGSVPLRDWNGALPVPAARVGDGWAGMWPSAAHPAATEPRRDYIVSANNLQIRGLDGVIGVDWPAPFRALRITRALAVRRDWTVASTASLQRDVRSLLADRTIARAIAAARRVGEDSAAASLAAWDHMVDVDAEGAPLFFAWFYVLRALVAGDEWAGAPDGRTLFPTLAMLRVLEEGAANPWVDDVTTSRTETLRGLEERAMRTAVEMVGERHWGAVHQERHFHPLGRDARLDRLFGFNIGPYPVAGGPNTVRSDAYMMWRQLGPGGPEPPWISEYGPSQRLVVEMAPGGPRGYVLIPTGESGNPFSPHYRDMNDAWRAGDLVSLSLGEAVRRPEAALMLTPENE